MERHCCEVIYGAPMTLQGYRIEYNNRFPKTMYRVVFFRKSETVKYYGFEMFLLFSFLNSAEYRQLSLSRAFQLFSMSLA